MKTTRLTMSQALVRWLCAQRTVIDDSEQPLFGGVFAIFGHGNVTCLGEALEAVQDTLPTWRGQNEQSMALAGVAYAKAKKRRQIMVATSSIGPGALNMVTAAGVAHSNRLPILLLSGETFAKRVPDPVLQQVEHFSDPTVTVNDAFKAVTRYWDRITRPEQIVGSLPQAVATMLDPADCGPAFLALAQDVQGEAYDYPEKFFEPTVWRVARPRPDVEQLIRLRTLANHQTHRRVPCDFSCLALELAPPRLPKTNIHAPGPIPGPLESDSRLREPSPIALGVRCPPRLGLCYLQRLRSTRMFAKGDAEERGSRICTGSDSGHVSAIARNRIESPCCRNSASKSHQYRASGFGSRP